ncbi:hypothetical protein RUM43_008385 [Polyplax serrata]|uniref:receptor protein serine/threonine kinase n=1 Tax=Polyplax serrata TaxID=468196 RepID=A0AAN8Q723_POLSC
MLAVIACEQHVCWYTSHSVGKLSVHLVEASPEYSDELDYGGQISGQNQTCSKMTHYCYALWKEIPSDYNHSAPRIVIIAQGCWESTGKQDCENISCVTKRKPPKALNDTNFCCCKGDFCNGNMTQLYYTEDTEILELPDNKVSKKSNTLALVIFIIVFLILAACLPVFVLLGQNLNKSKNKNVKNPSDFMHLVENGTVYNPKLSHRNVKMKELIGQGRYGSVWKGCDERVGTNGSTEYLLFLSLAPNGSVQDFLNANVLDWNTFCNMGLSIAKGLAYLHSDIKRGDKSKPCISHRDLNTKNILVKEDLTCVICDLGFATKISGSRYYYNGEEQHAEIKSINDVGTLRYMSPEVLDGAVNLRDCETALKQIDVYALGLILWEIATQCTDFYPPGIDCPTYRLPFEAETSHPTFEQMQILVCKHRARPLFPDQWRDVPAVRAVKETIEDCWDQDAEARLTALCVEERFNELTCMSERQKVGFYSASGNVTHAGVMLQNSQNVFVSNGHREETCTSQSTVDSSLTLTPANPKNSNELKEICPQLTVQPYQGRNPCLERNLMLHNQCDPVSAELIDKSEKSSNLSRLQTNEYQNFNSADTLTDSSYSPYANYSEPLLRSTATASTPIATIPFVQNVKGERTTWTPKQSNLSKSLIQKKKLSWKNVKRVLEARMKANLPSHEKESNINLISSDNYVNSNLSSPVAPQESKLGTQVFLHNGKIETTINRELGMYKDKNIDFVENSRNFLLKLEKQSVRPNTLPLSCATELVTTQNETKKKEAANVPKKIDSPIFNQTKRFVKSEWLCGSGSGIKSRVNVKEFSAETTELRTLRLQSKIVGSATMAENLSSDSIEVGSLGDSFGAYVESQNDEKIGMSFNLTVRDAMEVKPCGDLFTSTNKIKRKGRLSLHDDRIMSGIECSKLKTSHCHFIFKSIDDIKFGQNI